MWYEKFGFEDDPYVIRGPRTIPLERIKWNRDDLSDKRQLDRFIDRVLDRRRVGMKVYGGEGCGKTWLLRYMEKILEEKSKGKALVLYSYAYIPALEPTFSVFYEGFVREIEKHLSEILKGIDVKAGHKKGNWEKCIGDRDLATALSSIYDEEKEKAKENRLYKNWLYGKRIALRELGEIGIASPLVGDYKKYEVMRTLIENCFPVFSSVTLVVDELENAPPGLAKGLGDSLRDLIDSFYDRFSLVCAYTTEIADEMIDWGYGIFLYKRLEHAVRIAALEADATVNFLRIHHECYRKAGYKVQDQLFPFEESGVRRLIALIDPKQCYPRTVLTNCGVLADEAARQDARVTAEFVDGNKEFLTYLAESRGNLLI